MDDLEMQVVAWHEAGHAVVAYELRWRVLAVAYNGDITVTPPNEADNATNDNAIRSDEYLLDRITIGYGGEFGQLIKPAPIRGPELKCDQELIAKYSAILTSRGCDVDLCRLRRAARGIVVRYEPAIRALAAAVLRYRMLIETPAGSQFEDIRPHYIIESAMAAPQ